ncbi:GH-E family nuclease [Actinoallomurus sp. CA-150999]|uniref:GH-E family nuclease n=1 Tax=Actinoallomurus sp. CA-150999 TaxID=3239887 RepID=UPI003D8F0DFE
MGAPDHEVRFDTWTKAGRGMDGAADTLASTVDTLCHELAGAGAPWGQDDIGQAFFNGSGEVSGFGVARDSVLSALADMVNLLRATGGNLIISGNNDRLAEDASTIGAAVPEGAETNALAQKDPYRLPQVSESLARSDPPPGVVQQILGFLETLVGGIQWPDGDMDGLGRIKNAFTTAATAILGVAQDVEEHARTVTANNAGDAVDAFATFAAALHGGGEDGGLLWLAGMCQWLADSVDFLMRQKDAARLQFELSCAFLVLTWAIAWAISWITGGGSVAAAEAATEVEGFALRSFLRSIATTVAKAAVGGAWFAGGMDLAGQYARIHEGIQKDFDGDEFAHALEEGAIAGAVMGGAGGAVAARSTPFTTKLADLMASSGLARAGFAGVTGTAGNIAAQGLVEHKVDLGQAAAFGFGMAGLGYAGEVGKHVLGQTAAPGNRATSTGGDIPNNRGYPNYSAKGVGYDIEGQVVGDGTGGHTDSPARVESAGQTDLADHTDAGHGGTVETTDRQPHADSSSYDPVSTRSDSAGGTETAGDGATTAGYQNSIDGIINENPTHPSPETGTDVHAGPNGQMANSLGGHGPDIGVVGESHHGGVGITDGGVEPTAGNGSGPVVVHHRDGTTVVDGQGIHQPADGAGPSGTPDPGHGTMSDLAGNTGHTPTAPQVEQPPATGSVAEPAGSAQRVVHESPPRDVPVAVVPLDQGGRGSAPHEGGPARTSSRPVESRSPQTSRSEAGYGTHQDEKPGNAHPTPGSEHQAGAVAADRWSDVPGFDPGRTGSGPREAHPIRSADLNPDTRQPLMPAYGKDTLAVLRGGHAYALTEGEALQASQWTHLREDATATPVTREHHPFEDASKVDVRRLGVTAQDGGERSVTEFTVTVQYHADPTMTSEDVVRAQSNVLDAVDIYYNHQHRLVDGSQLHVRVEFEEAGSADGAVRLRPGDGMGEGERPDMLTLYADMDPVAIAHEVGHHLDLHDEYADPGRPGAETLTAPGVTREPNLMGDGLRSWADRTLIVDHNGHPVPSTAGLRDRHLIAMQGLADRAAPGAPDVHGVAGPMVPVEHAVRENRPLDPPDHVRELLDRVGEDGRPVFPAEGRDALEHAVLLDRMHVLFGDEARTAGHLRYTEALTDAAGRLYETAPDYSFREPDLHGLRHLADVVGASPEGALPHADLLHELAHQTLGRNPTPREVEALTRLAEHLNDRMDGRRPRENPSDALHRAAADRLGTAPGPETTRRAIGQLAAEHPHAPDPGGEHPVPRMGKYERDKRQRIDAANSAMRDFEERIGRRLSPQERHRMRQNIHDDLDAIEREKRSDSSWRPGYRNNTRAGIERRYDKNGNLVDANTGEIIPKGRADIGHKPGYEWKDFYSQAKKMKLTDAQIRELAQYSDAYHMELDTNNRGHKYEQGGGASKFLEGHKKHSDGSVTVRGLRIYPDGRVIDAETKKPIKKSDVPKSWKREQKKAEEAAKKEIAETNKYLNNVAQKSNPTAKERKALELQQQASEKAKKAENAVFFKGSAQKEAMEAQRKADEAIEKAKKKWWQ